MCRETETKREAEDRRTWSALMTAWLVGAVASAALLGGPIAGLAEAQQLSIQHFAGTAGGPDFDDGTGPAARFYYPSGVATDSAGNIYVADSGNHAIRKISPAGVTTTLAGTTGAPGYADGTGAAARFHSPQGVAIDSTGNLYVADRDNNAIRKITPAGITTTLAGTADYAGTTDGTGPAARFNFPTGVTTDSVGNVYVADHDSHTIRKITPAGVTSTLAGTAGSSGSADGTGTAARFYYPNSVTADSAGNVFVADSYNHTIRKVTPAGVTSTLAGTAGSCGSTDGTGPIARFCYPRGVAADSAGNVFVADNSNQIIRKVTPAGVVSTVAGTAGYFGSTDGTGPAARFFGPNAVATDSTGNAYVADTSNHTIRKITPAGVTSTLAGTAVSEGSIDGTGPAARFNKPTGVATDSAGNVFVADHQNQTIRKITPAGVTSTFAGTAGLAGSADGTGPAARFYYPRCVATDSTGNVYVADTSSHTIRMITPAGVTSTFAGTAGLSGYEDGTGPAARFYFPMGVATDAAGYVYVADRDNHTIRKITPTGGVSTLAGTAGSHGSTDGTGLAARFYGPNGVATDSTGNVYVADTGNHTVRKITPAGVVSTLAGTAGFFGSTDGTGPAARFRSPDGVATDSTGNVYVADTGNHTIRKITPAGVTTTVAGTAGSGGPTDGTGAAARLNFPDGIATDSVGNVYIADTYNHTVRRAEVSIADVATIDSPTGCVGTTRQLDTTPQTATAWTWTEIRQPSGSAAALSATDIRNPVFTPDIPGIYTFRLDASGLGGRSITTVSFAATALISGPSCSLVCAGDSTSFTVTPTATGGVTFQWYKDGALLPGRIGSTLFVSWATLADDGFYSCDVTDDCGTKSSPAARLFVSPLPSIGTHPTSLTRCVGSSASFSVTATGATSHQWKRNGTAISGATTDTYTIPSVAAGDAASYSCTVTNACGRAAQSNAATLSVVTDAPAITSQPASVSACTGNAVSFSVTAPTATSHQWKKDSTPIPGAIASTYTIASVVAGDAGSYSCDVTNECGMRPSFAAVLAIDTLPSPTPGTPGLLSPNAGTTVGSLAATLSWGATTDTARYKVFLGTTNPPPFYAEVQVPTVSLGTQLAASKTYYWKIVSYPTTGGAAGVPSAVWSFTTPAAAETLLSISPATLNRWDATPVPVTLAGSGFGAGTGVAWNGPSTTPGAWTPGTKTATQLRGTLTPDGSAHAGWYDVRVSESGTPVAGLLQSFVLRAFTDVTEADWYFDSSERMMTAGIIPSFDGASGPEFRPTTRILRSDMAEFLVEAHFWKLGWSVPNRACLSYFPDVACGHPQRLHIEWAKDLGIALGNAQGNFVPDGNVTRAEMAAFLERLKWGGDGNVPKCYPDPGWSDLAEIPDWSEPYVHALRADRITAGCSASPLAFCSLGGVQRSEVATFLARLVGEVPLP
jgi:hypothetical protein